MEAPRLVTHLSPPRSRLGGIGGAAAVVIDVLRASTTIATALANGAREVLAVVELDEARAARAAMRTSALLAGERGCVRPEGFDLGNSPREMTRERVAGRTLVMSTSNGTRALLAAAGARELLVGCYVSLSATAARVLATGRDVHLVCAGVDGELAADDVSFAGALAARLLAARPFEVDDGTRVALSHAPRSLAEDDVLARIEDSGPARRLASLGFRADVEFAARVDQFDGVVTGTVDGTAVRLALARPDNTAR